MTQHEWAADTATTSGAVAASATGPWHGRCETWCSAEPARVQMHARFRPCHRSVAEAATAPQKRLCPKTTAAERRKNVAHGASRGIGWPSIKPRSGERTILR